MRSATQVAPSNPSAHTVSLVSEDLYLDLWLSADGRTILRLDEDEFAASRLSERDPTTAAHAVAALTELEDLAALQFRTIVGDFPAERCDAAKTPLP